jgi:hypothetical protein
VTFVDIRIGILNSPRELSFETSQTAAEIEQAVTDALSAGTVLSLADDKGKQYVVPAVAIGYVEIGSESTRRIGFVG